DLIDCNCINHYFASIIFVYLFKRLNSFSDSLFVINGTSSKVAKRLKLTCENLELSDKTKDWFERAMAKRLIAASSGSGVVYPASVSKPFVPMNAWSK